jgi:hypothetical protein
MRVQSVLFVLSMAKFWLDLATNLLHGRYGLGMETCVRSSQIRSLEKVQKWTVPDLQRPFTPRFRLASVFSGVLDECIQAVQQQQQSGRPPIFYLDFTSPLRLRPL